LPNSTLTRTRPALVVAAGLALALTLTGLVATAVPAAAAVRPIGPGALDPWGVDKFDCTDGFGFSDPLLAGTYDVTVTATGSGGDVGASGPIADVVIKAPNVLTHLGRVKVTIQ